MTIAIVHYHLGPGGVSKVIAVISRLLGKAGIPHVILVGAHPPPAESGLPVRMVPGLEYDGASDAESVSAASLVDSLMTAARDALGGPPDVWHFHNHSLGRNSCFTGVVEHLATAGERLLLQIHDLAEDGRPSNHACLMARNASHAYPLAERIHYAFINSRDRRVFTMAGLPQRNASVLANPVGVSEIHPAPQSGAALVFAPVRGIRRKNLGEMILLAALAPSGTRFAISQAPLDLVARSIHDTWQRFSRHHGIPIDFDVVGNRVPPDESDSSFGAWVRRSTHWVSTSVSEGFGLCFLEAVAHGKPLIGRRISHLSDDHARHGLVPGDLYDRLLIPGDWVDPLWLKDHLQTTLERNYRLYRRIPNNEGFSRTLQLLHDGEWLDFGNLPEPIQQSIIERVMGEGNRRAPQVEVNGTRENLGCWLDHAIARRIATAGPESLKPWSPQSVLETLLGIYRKLSDMPSGPLSFIEPARVLDQYLGPSHFHFLKSAPKPTTPAPLVRAIIFDVYGTLLNAPAGGVKVDFAADAKLRRVIGEFGFSPPDSPSSAIHEVVRKHHDSARAAGNPYPEVDLRESWREALGLDEGTSTEELVMAIEAVWHPAAFMPGAKAAIQYLAASGLPLGILSNAQCNTAGAFGDLWNFFDPDLVVLSYQHGMAKPSRRLFEILAQRLGLLGIQPSDTLLIGNDPLHDIIPAAAHGFRTALFAGHPDSKRPGECAPDHVITGWSQIPGIVHPPW